MQVSVETTSGLERRMTVTVPADHIENEVNNRLKSLSRTVRLSGFRPGKVPVKVVATRYGAKVRDEVINEVTRSSFQEALSRENLKLAGLPKIEPANSEPGADLQFTAIFEVLAEVELVPLETLEIEKPVAEISDEDVESVILTLRQQHASWQQVDRPAALDDQVVIDFTGTIDGKEFEGGSGQQVPLKLGANAFIPGFEDNLIGAEAGAEVTADVVFPEDYHVSDIAGKAAQFQIKVHSVSEQVLPEVDEEFMRKFEVENSDHETFVREVRDSMQRELDQGLKDRLKQNVLDVLYEKNPVEVPRGLVESTMDDMLAQASARLANQGVDVAALPEEHALNRDIFAAPAQRKVALGMLVGDIARKNGFAPEPDKVRAMIEGIAENYDNPEEIVRWYYADRQRLANIETLALEDRVVEWVLTGASVTERSYSFADIMQKPGA